VRNVTAVDEAGLVAEVPAPQDGTIDATRTAIGRIHRCRGVPPTVDLLAQFHPLVTGALQELLVLLLAHLLAAFLDQ
jgi:hypothetical protein